MKRKLTPVTVNCYMELAIMGLGDHWVIISSIALLSVGDKKLCSLMRLLTAILILIIIIMYRP